MKILSAEYQSKSQDIQTQNDCKVFFVFVFINGGGGVVEDWFPFQAYLLTYIYA